MQKLTLSAIVIFVLLVALGTFTHSETLGWLELVQLAIAPFELLGLGVLWSLRLNKRKVPVKSSGDKKSGTMPGYGMVTKWASYTFTLMGIILVLSFVAHRGSNEPSLLGRSKSYIDLQVGCVFLVAASLLSFMYYLQQKHTFK